MSAERTPTPWQHYWRESEDEADCGIYSEQRHGHFYAVARCPRYQNQERWEADASLICHAVNSHDALVAALKHAEPWVESGPAGSWRDGVMAEIAAALAKAEGRS